MKCIIDCQVVLSRAPEGPLASHVGSFARSLSKQGYSRYSIHQQVRLAACFSRWLKQLGVGLRSVTSDHPPRYLRYRARHVRPSLGDAAALRHLLEFLRSVRTVYVLATDTSWLKAQPGCTCHRFSRPPPSGPWEHIPRVPGLSRSRNPVWLHRHRFGRPI